MPLQGLMFLIFVFLIIPLLMLSTNQYIFFAVTAIVLTVISIRSIFTHFFSAAENEEDTQDDGIEELEDMFDLNIKKFGTGINVIKSLFLILFYVYCSFSFNSILMKLPAALLIVIQIHQIRTTLRESTTIKKSTKMNRNLKTITSVLSIILIISTGYFLLF